MQVYKFGGASIATPERMKALLPIFQEATKPLIIIVSALGKTTNALEAIAKAAIENDKAKAIALFNDLENAHKEYIRQLFDEENNEKVLTALAPYFTEISWAIDDAGIQSDKYVYDQIVCIGELLSTKIIATFLTANDFQNEWIDARDIVKTDERYRHANVDEKATQENVDKIIKPILSQQKNIVIQGFIGSSSDNNSTTLGREGSDYTAALMAAMTDSEKVTIWKDVPGFLSADPRLFPDAVRIPEITYHEVIELTYYGAQIIHPKTIKPLHNKKIPLFVKCFLDKSLEGTYIHAMNKKVDYPPLVVIKPGQSLIKLTTLDFSFITEDNLSHIYQIFHKHNVKINMIQNAAISFVACIDTKHFAIETLQEELEQFYVVKKHEAMTLLTIRHYDDEIVNQLTNEKRIQLVQKTKNTYQALYRI